VAATGQAGITADVMGRPKHIYSIHKKMQSKSLSYDQLYDIRAVRLLVDNVPECYSVLSLVHDLFTPILGEFDDYIAQPKANNYQSLHTAVIGAENKTLEVQIRTHAMHQASEHGVAAHWRYKEGKKDGSKADKSFAEKIAWLRQVLEWKQEIVDEGEFSDSVKQGLFADTIYVLTPQGRVVDLPAGSTAVDFAYHLHTDLGHRCRGAKIDGHLVALNTPLKNAQRVEILSAKQGGPSRDWINPQLGFLKSHRALSKVRTWFRQEYFEVDVAHGRQALDKELARHAAANIAQDKLAHALEHKSIDELLAAIGRNEITAHQIDIALRGMLAPAEVAPDNTVAMPLYKASSDSNQTGKASSGVLVLGVNNIATMVARCCKPLPPDDITGFVTRTRGVTVHRLDCENIVCLSAEQRERLMPAAWGAKLEETAFSTEIEAIANDRQGLLRDISEILSREKINVTAVNTLSKNSMASMRFTLEVRRNDDITRVIRAVSGVMGVESVKRR
jgi:GTP pyrophosphokinase